MSFYHFGVSENLEKDMFKKSFEIMESYRKKEEVHAPGGWQVCCLFHAARELQTKEFISGSPPGDAKKGGKEDGGVAVVEFFHDFEFAETSEYKKLDKKMDKDCLLVYERVKKAGLATLMSSTWVRLGHKNALDTMTGLVKISQRMASATTSNSQPELLQKMRFVIGIPLRADGGGHFGQPDWDAAPEQLLGRAPDGAQADGLHEVALPIQQEH